MVHRVGMDALFARLREEDAGRGVSLHLLCTASRNTCTVACRGAASSLLGWHESVGPVQSGAGKALSIN